MSQNWKIMCQGYQVPNMLLYLGAASVLQKKKKKNQTWTLILRLNDVENMCYKVASEQELELITVTDSLTQVWN